MEQLKYIPLFAALLFSTTSGAQQVRPIYYGISGGLTSNVIVGSEIDRLQTLYNTKMSHRTGPTFSVYLKKELTPFVYLKGELGYVRRGNVCVDNSVWNLDLEYVSIPLKFGFQPINSYNNSKGFQFGLEGGVSLNWTPGHGMDNLASSYAANFSNIKSNKLPVSAVFGANFEYRLSQRRILFFNTTWYNDLTPILSYEVGSTTYKAANRGWIFAAGLLFPLH